MKTITTNLLFCLILQSGFSQTFNPLLAGMLQDTLDTYVTAIPSIKGMSAAVYYPGQGIWQGVSGDSYDGEPITPDMQLGIASNTKLFVSTVMLKLQEDNIISLDDSLHTWLPDYANVDHNITIRQLLNHTSGISDPIFVSPWMDTIMQNPDRVFTPEEVLSWLTAPFFAPGTSWGYSNVNYILAGMIAENATGFHISELIRNYILTPLNMDSTFYDVEEPESGTVAHRWYNTIDYNDTSRVGLNSAGGCAGSIFSTSSEMVQWYHALLNGEIINNTSLAEMTDFVSTGIDYYDYGLGITRETTLDKTYWGHGGSTWGYKSKMMYDTCLNAVVCGLVNSWPAGDAGVVYLLYNVIVNHVPGCSDIISGPTTICQGTNDVTYSIPAINHATSYLWTLPFGVTGVSVTNSITVDFDLTAISGDITVAGVNDYANGPASKIFITVNPKPVEPEISNTLNTLHSSSPIGNQWYNSAGLIPGEINQDYIVNVEDDYSVIVTIAGCSSESSEVVHIIPVGIESFSENINISLSPNPVDDFCTLLINNNKTSIKYILFNQQGQELKTGSCTNKTTISMRDLSAGVYILKIFNGETNEFIKLVKE